MDQVTSLANAVLTLGALSMPFVILVGLARGDRSKLGRAIGRRAIRLSRRRHV